MAEIGSRSADIVDIALEIRHSGHVFRLAHNRRMAPAGDHAALMEGQRAEIAGAETAAVMNNRKPHLFYGGHSALRIIHRMRQPHVRQF